MNSLMFSRWARAALLGSTFVSAPTQAENAVTLDEIVTTATGRPEPRSAIAGTVQVVDRERIERSPAKSVTDLLAKNAVGFFSEWTPGQTSINIRGGASDGQGRDFKSQVLVLINGHRAGTANLSKLSLADVERIEVVRGPASVIYGSQNIGGVVNIILKTGRTAPGTLVEGTTGVWGLLQGRAQTGGVYDALDYYVGASGGQRGNYHAGVGGGEEVNTDWKRKALTGALGVQLNPDHRLDFTMRTDGIYDEGFRGSAANVVNRENRYNGSFDASYTGQVPGGAFSWFMQAYAVNDVDDLKWASPIQRGANNQPQAGTSADFNRRNLDIAGTRVQPRFRLWDDNELLTGWDWEESWLRSDRIRAGVRGAKLAQVPPMDNNQTDNVHAFYAEDVQRLFDNRLTLRGGVRRTFGETSFDPTPFLANQKATKRDYEATTYSAGATLKTFDWMTFRLGASSGFRAPTASELAADFTALGGGRTFGNPNLKPETSQQVEAGVTLAHAGSRLDLALFQNVISDRVITKLRTSVANTSDFANNSGNVVVQGMEVQFDTDVFRLVSHDPGTWRWTAYANGNYNFHMKDEGTLTSPTANTHRVERV